MGPLSDKGKVDIPSHCYMIDDIEAQTGLDFFSGLPGEDDIERSQLNLSARESALPKHLFKYPVWACQEFR